jgi:hypothetical protein
MFLMLLGSWKQDFTFLVLSVDSVFFVVPCSGILCLIF